MPAKNDRELIKILKSEIVPALGCTEPIAVAYSAAVAKRELTEKVNERVTSIELYVDPFLFKNAMRVGIPGTNKKGALIAAALGYVSGNPDKKLEVISGVDEKDINKAVQIMEEGIINLHIEKDKKNLYIKTVITTENNRVQVITEKSHLNIVSIEKQGRIKYNLKEINKNEEKIDVNKIQHYSLAELIKFVDNIALTELRFFVRGIEMNKKIAEEGLKKKNGIAKNLADLKADGLLCDNAVLKAEIMTAAASEARMTGCKYPVMSSTGSGNQGITIFLTLSSFAEHIESPQDKLFRALALSNLIAVYIKSYLGSLSVLCGAAVAAGAGAAAGVAYLMGGRREEIYGAVLNVMGSITGLVCDGAKGGCAYKICLSSGWAIKAALLAVRGVTVDDNDGILSDNLEDLIKNLAYLNQGLKPVNNTILEIMMKSLNKQ